MNADGAHAHAAFSMTECFWCGITYDGTYYRWLCPNCGAKGNCCEGEPCPMPTINASMQNGEECGSAKSAEN